MRTAPSGLTTTQTSSASCDTEPSPGQARRHTIVLMRTLYFVPVAAIALTSLAACKPAAESRAAASASTQAQPPAAQTVLQAAPVATAGNGFTGAIAETMDSGGYTYARLQAAGKDDV